MKEIPQGARQILEKQHFLIVSSVDKDGSIDTSAKGILEANPKGRILLLDLYKGRTYNNVKRNPNVTLTMVDENRFRGFSVKGKARIVKEGTLPKNKLELWHDKVSKRIARRLIKQVKDDLPGGEKIPEASFPMPKYIIEVKVDSIIDLAPGRKK